MSIYIQPEKIEEYLIKYTQKLKEAKLTEEEIVIKLKKFVQNELVIIYTKEFMDENLNYWIDTILNVQGGYWIVQDLIHQPHCEYEHYQWRNKMSYEKGNVGNQTAKRELTPRNYEIYMIGKKLKAKTTEYNISTKIYIPLLDEDNSKGL